MRTPSPSQCRLDLAPPLADQFIFEVYPHRLRPGTSPHALRIPSHDGHPALRELRSGGFRSALVCFRLSPSCPFRLLHTYLSPGPRGITPRVRIWRSSFERQRDLNPPEQDALLSAQYATVRLPTGVHVGLLAHDLLQPARRGFRDGRRWGLPVLARGVSMHAWGLRLRGVLRALAIAHPSVLPSAMRNDVGTPVAIISQLNTLPACAPVNASMAASRLAMHDSGSGWFAKPFLYDSFIHYSTPVYPGAPRSLLTNRGFDIVWFFST